MREGAKCLSPDDAKVAPSAFVLAKCGERPVEDVAEQVAAETSQHGLTTTVEMIRNVAEGIRCGDLQEETH